MQRYRPEAVAQYFDELGEQEWVRHVSSPAAEVKLHLHTHYLRKYIRPPVRVLDAGAGAGRFTQVLAQLGASVVVADISTTQLALNRKRAAELGTASAVTDWLHADVCDLSALADDSFDAVVCYGGPISYVFEQRERALAELRRVLRPGGIMLLSVMTLWGTIHEALPAVLQVDAVENLRIIETGDLTLGDIDSMRHQCHLFRASDLQELLTATGWEIVTLSASNSLSTAWRDKLDGIRKDPPRWAELLAMEVEACAQSGALDMGTHLIAVARRPE